MLQLFLYRVISSGLINGNRKGETVLDLSSGAGFDCFLAADNVGNEGEVIGVDMTSEMVEKAKDNARKSNYTNLNFHRFI